MTDTDPQVLLDDGGQIRYVEVIEQSGEAQDLFKRCVKWINGNYKNPATVTPTRDMVNKKIVIRHQFQLEGTNEEGVITKGGLVMYDMTIRFIDGRFRAEITNFTLNSASRFPAENWLPQGSHPNAENLKQIDDFAKNLIASLKEGMQPEKEHVEEDW